MTVLSSRRGASHDGQTDFQEAIGTREKKDQKKEKKTEALA